MNRLASTLKLHIGAKMVLEQLFFRRIGMVLSYFLSFSTPMNIEPLDATGPADS